MLYALAGRPATQRGRDLIYINSLFGDLFHTSRYSKRAKMTLMRAVIKLTLLSLLTFTATFAARRIFFWDVMPVSWSQDPSPTGALMTAYLLLSLENVAAAVAAIALMAGLALWISGRQETGLPPKAQIFPPSLAHERGRTVSCGKSVLECMFKRAGRSPAAPALRRRIEARTSGITRMLRRNFRDAQPRLHSIIWRQTLGNERGLK